MLHSDYLKKKNFSCYNNFSRKTVLLRISCTICVSDIPIFMAY